MSTWVYFILLIIGLGVAWLGWRHFVLLRALRLYEDLLRMDWRTAESAAPEFESVSSLVRQLLVEGAQRLSQVVAERDRLDAVLDQMADGVLIANSTGEVQYSNPAAARIFQVSNPPGKTVTEVLRDHRLVYAWRLCAQSGGMQNAVVEVPTRHQYIQLVVVPDTHGGGSLLLAQDLTRMHRLETVRQDFVSNFSHELRTPLASLRALAETLLDGALRDPQVAPRFLQRIVAEVESLTQMSQELLDLTAIESGKAALHLEPTNPRTLLESTADRMRLQVDRAGLRIQVDCPEALPFVLADAARLGQVLLNLIHNAVKFTPPGGHIMVSAQTVQPDRAMDGGLGSFVQFLVRDTGAGIAADDMPRIFERFYRSDRARTKGGTGMGLSIARHLVEAHGGRVWAESVEGEGSTFSFTIPRSL
jgi:two-component system phosphate regulon sensor histidine kinase PhoR